MAVGWERRYLFCFVIGKHCVSAVCLHIYEHHEPRGGLKNAPQEQNANKFLAQGNLLVVCELSYHFAIHSGVVKSKVLFLKQTVLHFRYHLI